MEEVREEFLRTICEARPYKAVVSCPQTKEETVRRIVFRLQEGRRGRQYQLEKFTETQAFHINIEERGLYEALNAYFGRGYAQLEAWAQDTVYRGKISKKGKLLTNCRRNSEPPVVRQGNNESKRYCIPEGTVIPPLIDMGIFTQTGAVVKSRYDKYRQINRFLEMVRDVLKELPEERLHIVDFGCGKSYLTFLLYYYLTQVEGREVHMTGLDRKESVIAECRRTAEKYGYEHLEFQTGEIGSYESAEPVHMVVTLHACDTATDYALYHAVRWGTQAILSVPCCQHELNQHMELTSWKILNRYGIVRERTAALMTDAMRANLLEVCGYRTQLLEFVEWEHSPKNILIRAVKGNPPREKRKQALAEVEELRQVFSAEPALYRLLQEQGMLTPTEKP